MRKVIFSVVVLWVCYCCNTTANVTTGGVAGYKKSDLKKIKWIEGKWRGMYQNQPFYEFYQFLNDSTLQITSFNWNGKDSSKTERSYVYWKEGAYFLGAQLNWKTTSISKNEIIMKKNNKASNDIVWRYNDKNSWDAILESAKGVTKYHMERFDPFKQ